MAQPVQTVVYRFTPAHDPAWQFYSMPESIVGGGKTLKEARAEYQDALRFSLDVRTLPNVREYIEREIGNLGIWMRLPIDHPNFDGVVQEMHRQIEAHPDGRPWFFENSAAGGDPVIVTAAAESPLSSILDQMTIHDSLILAMLYRPTPEKVQNVWLALTGAENEAGNVVPPTSLAALGLTADSPVQDLLNAALKHEVKQVRALALC